MRGCPCVVQILGTNTSSGMLQSSEDFRREFPLPSEIDYEDLAYKRKGHPATGRPLLQGRIVPTEACKFRQNFLPKSYEPKNRGVKRFLGNKCLCFQWFTKSVNTAEECSKMRQIALWNGGKPIFLKVLTWSQEGFWGAAGRRSRHSPRGPLTAVSVRCSEMNSICSGRSKTLSG